MRAFLANKTLMRQRDVGGLVMEESGLPLSLDARAVMSPSSSNAFRCPKMSRVVGG